MSFPIEAYRDHLAAGLTHQEAVKAAREEFTRQKQTSSENAKERAEKDARSR